MQLWLLSKEFVRGVAEHAERAERAGWDGIVIPDSQNVIGDVFVHLTIAASVTSTLKLATGVTNPFIRHPAAVAAAASDLQQFTNGRFDAIGIGRGDAALGQVGVAPAPLEPFERFVRHLVTYLSGGRIPFEELDRHGYRAVTDLPVAEVPDGSRIQHMDPSMPLVSVDVAATGPKVIGIGARNAQRVSFTMGADARRIASAITRAREEREQAGFDPGSLSFGAYVNVVCHEDVELATRVAASGISIFSRFSSMHGRTTADMDDATAGAIAKLSSAYNMEEHGLPGASHVTSLDPVLVDRFAIVGGPDHCIDRLSELQDLGLDRVVVMGGLNDGTEASAREISETRDAFEEYVLPAVGKR